MIRFLTHLVDDDADTCADLKRFLNENGVEVAIYTDPEEFLKSEDKKRICIIDYLFRNSGIDGFEIAEKVLEQNKEAKIIMITGAMESADFINLLNIKAFKYVNKNKDDYKPMLLKYVNQAIEAVKEILEKEEQDRQIMEFAKKKNIK